MVSGAKINTKLEIKIKDLKLKNSFEHTFILSLLAGLVYIFYCLPNASDKIINADALYVPTLLQDLKSDLMNVTGWNFPPASYLFPDAVLFLPSDLFVTTSYYKLLSTASFNSRYYS